MCVCMVGLAHGFQGEYLSIVCRRSMLTFLCNKSDSSCFDEEFLEGAGEDGELIPDLQWRLAKAKLEEWQLLFERTAFGRQHNACAQ